MRKEHQLSGFQLQDHCGPIIIAAAIRMPREREGSTCRVEMARTMATRAGAIARSRSHGSYCDAGAEAVAVEDLAGWVDPAGNVEGGAGEDAG